MARRQPTLFDTSPEPWEADDAVEQCVAGVVFPTGPTQEFDYLVPDTLRPQAVVGKRVRAPFARGNRLVLGYCVKLETRTEPSGTRRRLKELEAFVDERSLLSPAMLRLTRWISDHYLCPWGQVLDAVLPAGVRSQAGTRMARVYSLSAEAAAGHVGIKLSPTQQKIVAAVTQSPRPLTVDELTTAVGCTDGPIRTLHRKGVLRAESQRIWQTLPHEPAAPVEADHQLNDDQRPALNAILDALRAGRHETLLLHGVTGSGKTEVYIRAIQEVVSFGRQAIVLVPEISLTPQTRQRFRARFPRVAVLHSHLSDVERHAHWQRIASGEVQVVVGARSAIFAPTPHLGLIILDEEHEATFKQDNAPRYHARDVALERARAEHVPLVLGSATPSLESWSRAKSGAYKLVEMPRRVLNLPMPDVRIIDMRAEGGARGYGGMLSRPLQLAMLAALKEHGQVILLLNRRGYSTHVQCPACGWAARCPLCEVGLTHHRHKEVVMCHYCDHTEPTPARCKECGFAGVRFTGYGSQKLEAEVKSRFAEYRCLRMDTDSMSQPGSHERALAAFRAGEIDVLLGTQMIAKGLDFPNVTLVGVVLADTALHLPDFRAAERTFQLLVQVAGRTGRGPRGGQVLVQTFSPDHPAIQAAARHDYDTFARQELPLRESLGYPPATTMVRLVIRGPHETPTREFARHVADQLAAAGRERALVARLLGPAPCPLAKLHGRFRYQIQWQGADGETLRAAVAAVLQELEPPAEIQWIVDVDPLDML